MKVLFVNAINENSPLQSYLPPLGLASLASALFWEYLSEVETRIIDRDVEFWLDQFKPDIVGISAVTQNYNRAKAIACMAKSAGAKTIIGGMHITALPQTITPDMDCAVIGEGERAFIEALKNTNPSRRYFDCPAIQNLNTIKPAARDLLPKTEHANIFTSRGCPYRCTFCASTRHWPQLRFFSADYVLHEIENLVESDWAGKAAPVNFIEIWDDLFIADVKRLRKIADGIHERGIDKTVTFSCNARANLVDGNVAGLLSLMNVKEVWLGMESGTDRILHYLKPQAVTVADNIRAIEILHNHGIKANGSFIFGSPAETVQEIKETLKFISKYKVDSFTYNLLTPLPGTPVWDYALRHGLVSLDMNWDRLAMTTWDNFDDAVILSETLSRKELKKYYREFLDIIAMRTVKGVIQNPLRLISPGTVKAVKNIFKGKPIIAP